MNARPNERWTDRGQRFLLSAARGLEPNERCEDAIDFCGVDTGAVVLNHNADSRLVRLQCDMGTLTLGDGILDQVA